MHKGVIQLILNLINFEDFLIHILLITTNKKTVVEISYGLWLWLVAVAQIMNRSLITLNILRMSKISFIVMKFKMYYCI